MPLYALHADYDQNGVLNASPSEYGARLTQPGALISPNLDVDGLALPGSVSCGSPPALDLTRATKSAGDQDLIRLAVIASPGTQTSQHIVNLKIGERDAAQVKLYDDSRHRLSGTPASGFVVYRLAFSGDRVDLFLEASTFNASPNLPANPAGGFMPAFLQSSPPGLSLQLEVLDLAGNLLERDAGLVSVSPLVLMGDDNPAERLYICERLLTPASLADNFASLADVRAAMRAARGVQLVSVPISVHHGDTWVQDQFQVGYTRDAGGAMKVVFHLPRLRSDANLAQVGSSLACIATDHFPSTNLGVFNDFWTRSISVRDVDQGTQSVTFINSVELMILFNQVFDLYYYLLRVAWEIEPAQALALSTASELADIIQQLPSLQSSVVQILDRASASETDQIKKNRLDNTKLDIQARVPNLLREINFRRDGALAARTQNLTLALEPEDVTQVANRLQQMHSSHNYGGNIEVTPPLSEAPLGKIVAGTTFDPQDTDRIDADLLHFLDSQRVQPVVVLDTAWLQVGHVDEIVNFIPFRGSRSSFAILMASPAKAMQILEEVFLLNTADLPDADPMKALYQRPYTTGDTNMARGAHPVTALLRGKHWLQTYQPRSAPAALPPKIYRNMNMYYGDIGLSTRRFYPIPWPDDHYYNARISVREMLYFGRSANLRVQDKIDAASETLSNQLEDNPIFELPVLFDDYNPEFEKTIAFTPDLVNYQSVNNRVLMARPYGPRMSIADTITVLRAVMDRGYQANLTRQYFIRKGLNKTYHWAVDTINELSHVNSGPYNRPVTVNLDWLAEQYKDGFFPETSDLDVIKRRIRTARANAGLFLPNGDLRTGWHKIEIPDGKVDVFEAYTQVLVGSTGVEIDWVDAWFYHVRSGGIHCGTNAIRTPQLTAQNAWWRITLGRGPGDYVIPDTETMVA